MTRTSLGAKTGDQRPVVSYSIIAVCVVVFLAQSVVSSLTSDLAFRPIDGLSEPWRVITHGFAHSPQNVLHLGFNMYAVFIAGSYLEPLLGRLRFAALYLTTMVAGAAAFSVIAGPVTHAGTVLYANSAVGASGAVFGLFGALLIVQRKLGRDTSQLLVLLGINVVLGFVIPNVAWQAHLGGFVAGVVCAGVLVLAPHTARGRLLFTGTLVVVFAASLLGVALGA